MRFHLEIEDSDVQRLREAYQRLREHRFVRERAALNVDPLVQRPTEEDIWRWLAMAVSTSQQRSSPGTRMWDLWTADPCPLRLEAVRASYPDIAANVERTLMAWGGIRSYHRIGGFLQANYTKLFDKGEIESLDGLLDQLWQLRQRPPQWDEEARLAERIICGRTLRLKLEGIGPKQCRNWLLNAHLLRYEVPLDSRVVKFLEPMMPPNFTLSRAALSDEAYYLFVEDAVQAVCRQAGIFPCVADAVMFLVADGRS